MASASFEGRALPAITFSRGLPNAVAGARFGSRLFSGWQEGAFIMETLRKYRRLARECDELAKTASAPEHRAKILEVAAVWRQLAAKRESLLQRSLELVHRVRRRG
jgi:hypothetical protein